MRTDTVMDVLRATTPKILEQVAFVFAEPTDSPEPFGEDVRAASIDFMGPLTGSLHLTTSSLCAAGLAANLLGVEPDDPAAVAYGADALGETLNILCGAVLLELFGAVDSNHFGLPRVSAAPSPDTSLLVETVSFMTDDGHRIDAGAVWRRTAP